MKYVLTLLLIVGLYADDVAETEYVIHPHKPVRSLSFLVQDNNGKKATAYEIIDKRLQKNITGKTLFSIGTELKLKIKFREYETIDQNIVIQPGYGSMLIKCEHLTKLREQKFTIDMPYRVIDGEKYLYEFSYNGKEIESHLFSQEKKAKAKTTKYTIAISRYATKIKVFCGFYFGVFPATSRTTHIYSLKNIDIDKYLAHLKKLEKRGGNFVIGKASRFIKSHKSYLQKNSYQDIEKLAEYLTSLELSSRGVFQLENTLLQLDEILE